MSYRKIEVNGKTFGFVVGKTHVKIRGEGFSKLVTKAEAGQPIGVDTFVVTPANIRDIVLGRPGPVVYRCACHLVLTSRMAFDPFAEEVHGKKHLMVECDECLYELAMDI